MTSLYTAVYGHKLTETEAGPRDEAEGVGQVIQGAAGLKDSPKGFPGGPVAKALARPLARGH